MTATPPPAKLMPALTLPDALVAVAVGLFVLAVTVALVPAVALEWVFKAAPEAGAPLGDAVLASVDPVGAPDVFGTFDTFDALDVFAVPEPLKSMTVELAPMLPLPATCVICETPLTETFCPPLAVACGFAPVPAATVEVPAATLFPATTPHAATSPADQAPWPSATPRW